MGNRAGRDTGVAVRGLVGKLAFRAGAFQGRRSDAVKDKMVGSRNALRVAARAQYNFFDVENGTFLSGTYLGAKKIFGCHSLPLLGAAGAPGPRPDFALSDFALSDFAPSDFALSGFAASDFGPSDLEPSDFALSALALSCFAPSDFAPSDFAPSDFAPSDFAPSDVARSVGAGADDFLPSLP